MPDWKQQLKEYLSFSKTERRGIVVLLVLLFILIIVNFSLPYLIIEETTDFQKFEREIADFEARQNKIADSLSKKFDFANIDESVAEQKIKPFPFDPNGLPVEKWKKLGLNEWQIRVIKNYENKGGRFYKNQDLKKIYSISDAEYELLKPFIEIKLNNGQTTKYEKEVLALNPFSFDPNKLPEEKWLEMGLRENLVHTIINYRDKGGRFYDNEDLKKIFGMKEQEYLILEPYMRIEKDTSIIVTEIAKKDNLIIDLNKADTLDLQQLKGIGPSYAKRIVKYRDMLGGYHSKKQLLEVYGMDSTRYIGFVSNIEVNSDSIIKININTATIKQMIKHPYIEFYMAKSIIKYREQIGGYTDLAQLLNAQLIYKELYDKIKPYLCIRNIK